MRAELIVKEDGMLAGLEEVLWYLKQQSQLGKMFFQTVEMLNLSDTDEEFYF